MSWETIVWQVVIFFLIAVVFFWVAVEIRDE